jgi:hypothetical protein
LASKRQPAIIQLQLVQAAVSTAAGTGLAVRPAWRQAAAQSPPEYDTSSQPCRVIAIDSATRSYQGSSVSRSMDDGHMRRLTLPRRSNTKRGALGIAAK